MHRLRRKIASVAAAAAGAVAEPSSTKLIRPTAHMQRQINAFPAYSCLG